MEQRLHLSDGEERLNRCFPYSIADTRRPEINDPGRCARLATCESEAQLYLCVSLGSQSSPVR
jgi:hypothetical protein